MKLFRWRAIVPALLALAIIVTLWMLFIDRIIRHEIESFGTDAVGAKVDLASARLRLRRGDLVLSGLQVTDPDHPMTNLVEVGSIAGAVSVRGLLRGKAVIDSLAVHGVRFGTPRKTSGAVAHPSATSVTAHRVVSDWVKKLPIPSLSLEGVIGTAVNIPAIATDSLKTLRQARAITAQGDSMKNAFDAQLRGLDPKPTMDSARALADRVKASDPRHMTPVQVAASAKDLRDMLARVQMLKARLDSAQGDVNRGVDVLHSASASLDQARNADIGYVHGLVHLPSFSAPDISRALFGKMISDHVAPVMYWVNMADKYIPPGLDPRRSSGPRRLRMAGTNFHFPVAHALPDFLIERAAGDVTINGTTAAAGQYVAAVTGVTTEPAIYGRPMIATLGRTSSVGPHEVQAYGSMDRTGASPKDSLHALVPSVSIPAFKLPGTNATLTLGDSSTVELSVGRRGAELLGSWRLSSSSARWQRGSDSAASHAAAPLGSHAWAESLVWNAIASISHVSVEGRIGGTMTSPTFDVSSNVGDALASNIQHALGAEVQKAEAQIKAKVDSMVAGPVNQAKARLTGLETELNQKVSAPRQQIAQLQSDLNAQLARMSPVAGVRIPGLPGVPRPNR